MGNRISIRDLREFAAMANKDLALGGSNCILRVGERYDYKAIDLYFIDETGKEYCQNMLIGGTPRECIERARIEWRNMAGKIGYPKKPSRAMAKAVLAPYIDFSADFHILPSDQVGALVTWAKLTGYKAPKDANGSAGRYFFYHLANRVKL